MEHKFNSDKQGRNIGIGEEMLPAVHWTRHVTCSPRVDVKYDTECITCSATEFHSVLIGNFIFIAVYIYSTVYSAFGTVHLDPTTQYFTDTKPNTLLNQQYIQCSPLHHLSLSVSRNELYRNLQCFVADCLLLGRSIGLQLSVKRWMEC